MYLKHGRLLIAPPPPPPRVYLPCIYVLNKIDQISIEELDIIYKVPHCVPISAHHRWNFDDLLEKIWDYLKLVRMWVLSLPTRGRHRIVPKLNDFWLPSTKKKVPSDHACVYGQCDSRVCCLFDSYTKPKGQLPDYTSPVVLPDDHTAVEDFCLKIHKSLIKEFK